MAKRARIRDIEKWAQTYWADNKTFETNAPALDYSETNVDLKNRKKYFVTFPYPYMNGRIHLGHTFTMTKAEFAASYQRLLGNDTLYPMGFHCTGMPISTSADKLKYEIKTYGFPPDLEALRAELKAKAEEKAKAGNEPKIVDKSKSRKSKAAAKQGTGTQWEIMKEGFGLTDEETKAFTDPQHWIDYFPPHAINDLSNMGLKADWRRSFITTDRNPYYDSFVRWQFTNLKKNGRIARGMRNSIFSPKDGQPCMDHDRAKGEGVGPQEYVLIKMKVLEDIGFNKPTFLVAGTLRAETMYGQTNCWISPTIKYVAVETRKGEIWICTKLAAKNMSWQLKLVGEPGDFKVLREIVGTELFGKALKAPLTKYEKVYALPMMTIKEDMGTGVVTVRSQIWFCLDLNLINFGDLQNYFRPNLQIFKITFRFATFELVLFGDFEDLICWSKIILKMAQFLQAKHRFLNALYIVPKRFSNGLRGFDGFEEQRGFERKVRYHRRYGFTLRTSTNH